jgi:hypothetical protein
VVVFASFIMPDNAVVKMFGVGLATAVLVDATIVRCVLVPSLMVLAARWTWWLPGWLDRALPHLHVEGDPAQLESVGAPRRPQRADARPGAGPVAAVLGAGAGWVAGALAVTSATPTVGAAIALAAASGAALAYLPRATRGADGLLWVRLVMMLAGALGAGALYLLVGGLTPATDHNPLLQSGVALLVPLAVATLTPLRRFAIPICMGTLATVAAMAAGGGLALDVVAVPTLVAALTSRVATLVGRALLPRPAPGPDDPAVNEPAVNAPAFNDPVVDSPAFTDPVVDSPDPTGPVHPDPGPAREAAGATIGPVRP